MAVTYRIYDETAKTTKSISVDFLVNFLAASGNTFASNVSYYFRIKTGARDTDRKAIPESLVLSLDELVLGGVKQRRTNIATDYTSIHDMIQDYLYDYVNGHAADLYSSGVAYRAPMQF
jgi:hypothetical protein